jgi:hypothetical protein
LICNRLTKEEIEENKIPEDSIFVCGAEQVKLKIKIIIKNLKKRFYLEQ